MRVRNCVRSALACIMAVYLLLHFGYIWTFGNFHISEQQPILLLAEIIIVMAIMIFSFVCMIKQLDNIGSRRKRP